MLTEAFKATDSEVKAAKKPVGLFGGFFAAPMQAGRHSKIF